MTSRQCMYKHNTQHCHTTLELLLLISDLARLDHDPVSSSDVSSDRGSNTVVVLVDDGVEEGQEEGH